MNREETIRELRRIFHKTRLSGDIPVPANVLYAALRFLEEAPERLPFKAPEPWEYEPHLAYLKRVVRDFEEWVNK